MWHGHLNLSTTDKELITAIVRPEGTSHFRRFPSILQQLVCERDTVASVQTRELACPLLSLSASTLASAQSKQLTFYIERHRNLISRPCTRICTCLVSQLQQHTPNACQPIVPDTEELHTQESCKQLNCGVNCRDHIAPCLLCESLQGACPMRPQSDMYKVCSYHCCSAVASGAVNTFQL